LFCLMVEFICLLLGPKKYSNVGRNNLVEHRIAFNKNLPAAKLSN
jgi:hypothetical protein